MRTSKFVVVMLCLGAILSRCAKSSAPGASADGGGSAGDAGGSSIDGGAGDGGGGITLDGGLNLDGGMGPDGGISNPCQVSADLDSFIQGVMTANNIPGLSAGIVSASGLRWAKGYGYADIAASRMASPETIFALMSISKTVTAVGVMQLVQAGTLNLDTNINSYLTAFQITHPAAPSTPITLRQLLAHTSGIAGDDYGVLQQNLATSDATVQPLGDMLSSLLTPSGSRYNSGANFSNNPPGTAFAYSSIGISLAGYVAQAVAGSGFDQLTNTNVFQPLGMTNTSWRLTPYEGRTDVAVMYNYDSNSASYTPITRFTFADYPAGSIRSNVPEFARYMAAFINNGTYGGQQILTSATVQLIRTVQYPAINTSRAIGWTYSGASGTVLGHGGDDQGASTDMGFDVTTGKGYMLFMNVTRRPNTDQLINRLITEANACP